MSHNTVLSLVMSVSHRREGREERERGRKASKGGGRGREGVGKEGG